MRNFLKCGTFLNAGCWRLQYVSVAASHMSNTPLYWDRRIMGFFDWGAPFLGALPIARFAVAISA